MIPIYDAIDDFRKQLGKNPHVIATGFRGGIGLPWQLTVDIRSNNFHDIMQVHAQVPDTFEGYDVVKTISS